MRDSGHKFALLQEPYADRFKRITGLPAGMRIFTDRHSKAAVVVDDPDVVCMPVEELTTECGVCVSISGNFGSIFLVSMYCRPGASLELYLLYMDAVQLLGSRMPVIYGLDANAASPLWFSKYHHTTRRYANRTRGQLLANWVLGSRVGVLNVRSRVYTFDNLRGRSDIDVTLVNEAASTWATYDWRVNEWDLSDHNYITVVVRPDPSRTVVSLSPVLSWKLSNANWQQFDGEIRREASESLPLGEFQRLSSDEQVSALTALVHRVSDSVLGRFNPRVRRRVIWQTAELYAARRELRRARRRLQRARRTNRGNVSELASYFRITRKEYERMMMAAKEEDWRRYVGEHRDDPWGHVYRICRGRKKSAEFGCMRVNDELCVTWHDSASALLRSFFPTTERPVGAHVLNVAPPALVPYEVDACVARVRSRRSPGLDSITGRMVKAVWRSIPEHMVALYSRCLADGYFPLEWKRPRVVALLKAPDKDRSDPASYRGICLLPVFGKVLEGIMVNRLKEVLVSENEFQFGFRAGRCVEDAWKHVTNSVAASSARYVLGIFVDFKGAFDHVEWEAALRRLSDVGCQETGIWRSFFTARKACMTSAFGEVNLEVTRGCPQGSTSGPSIWALLLDSLLNRLQTQCTFSAYADDLLLLVEGNARSQLETAGTQLMNIVGAWGNEVGVAVSTTKTAMMLLKGFLHPERKPTVRCAGATLKYVKQCRYLGITVGERMNFFPHITSVRDRLTGVVGALSRVLRVDWGISPRARRRIYAGLMVPCALFGASVWYGTVQRFGYARKALKACHRRILTGCLSTCHTVSTDALEVLAGTPPLELVAMRNAVRFKLKRSYPLVEGDWLFGQDLANLSRNEQLVLLDERLLSEWQRRWDDSERGHATRQFIPEVSFVYSRPNFGFKMLTSFLLTGHGSLNAFLFERKLSETAACPCGSPLEDWKHVLCVCPLYADFRDLDGLGLQQLGDGEWSYAEVLATPERLRLLERYAERVFRRRRIIVTPGGPGGPTLFNDGRV